jgi:hypothetical protein
MRAVAFLTALLALTPLFAGAAAPTKTPPPRATTKPATTRSSVDKPPKQLSETELRKTLDRIIEESDGENRRHQRQVDMIIKVKRDAVSIHDKDAIDRGNQMLDDEKHRHAERQKYLSDRYTEIQSELDARHPKPPK